MSKRNFYRTILILGFSNLISVQNIKSQTYCTQPGTERFAGVLNGYRYELWNQNAQGTACMTLGSGAIFSGEWSGVRNYLARRGLGYNQTQEHQEIGTFYSTFNCNYNPNSSSGNSYLSIYGWTVDPLKEFYIVEDWRNWIPSMDAGATLKGTINVNGSIYDIYENTRFNQPSIIGNTTFQQYFSIRRDERNSGTINISEHFDKWESLGMVMGKMYEVSFVVEGYQSSGNFEFTELDVFTGDNPDLVKEESKDKPHVTIFPNPASGEVSVKLITNIPNASLKIYNILGKIVFSKEIINNNELLISNLASGLYFVNVNNSRFIYNTELVIY